MSRDIPDDESGEVLPVRGIEQSRDEHIGLGAAIEVPGAQQVIQIGMLFQTVRDDFGDKISQ